MLFPQLHVLVICENYVIVYGRYTLNRIMGILTTFKYFATFLSIYKWMKGFNIYTNKIRGKVL